MDIGQKRERYEVIDADGYRIDDATFYTAEEAERFFAQCDAALIYRVTIERIK